MRTVEVYVRPQCIPCGATQRWLAIHQVKHVVKSAEDYADFLRLRLHHQSAPVIVIYEDGKHLTDWSGYRPDMLTKYLLDQEETAA